MEKITKDTYLVRFTLPGSSQLGLLPGQHLILRYLHGGRRVSAACSAIEQLSGRGTCLTFPKPLFAFFRALGAELSSASVIYSNSSTLIALTSQGTVLSTQAMDPFNLHKIPRGRSSQRVSRTCSHRKYWVRI